MARAEQLHKDPVFGILAGREKLEEPLAGKSTLNRMELGAGTQDRYKKVTFWRGVGKISAGFLAEPSPQAEDILTCK